MKLYEATGNEYVHLQFDPGTGKTSDEWSTVEVNQRILLLNGTQIDFFTIAEAMDGLKEGGKFRFAAHPT